MTNTANAREWIADQLSAIDPHEERPEDLAGELLQLAEDCGATPTAVSCYLHDPERRKGNYIHEYS
jgi:hypothetical protein